MRLNVFISYSEVCKTWSISHLSTGLKAFRTTFPTEAQAEAYADSMHCKVVKRPEPTPPPPSTW
jgi:hypothetical protein